MWNGLRALADKTVVKFFGDASSYDDVVNQIKSKTPNANFSLINLINIFLYIGGIVAVVMIIVSGIQMTTSAGDPGAVKKAKNTLIWSIVGLLVMILAYAIVNFVLGQITGTGEYLGDG